MKARQSRVVAGVLGLGGVAFGGMALGCAAPSRIVEVRGEALTGSMAPGPMVAASVVTCLAPGEEAALGELGQPHPYEASASGAYHAPEAAELDKVVSARAGVALAELTPGAAKAACYRKADQGDLRSFVQETAKASSAQSVLVPILYTIARCGKPGGEASKASCGRDELEVHLALFGADGARLWDSFERRRDAGDEAGRSVKELAGDVLQGLPASGFTPAMTAVEVKPAAPAKAEPEFEVEEALTDLDPRGLPDCRKWARAACEATTGTNAERAAACKDVADKANKAGKGKGAAASCAGMWKKLAGEKK